MTDNRTTELLRKLLDERGVEYTTNDHMGAYETSWNGFTATQLSPNANLIMAVTPEQAIAATLDDDDYERKMDALLCRLTNGKFSKSRAYDLDFMESCVNEEFEMLYADELNAAIDGGECEFRPFKDEDWSEPNAVRGVCSECSALMYGKDKYCPNCGKAVKR